MSCRVSQKDKCREIIFELGLDQDKVSSGVMERVRETATKLGDTEKEDTSHSSISQLHSSALFSPPSCDMMLPP